MRDPVATMITQAKKALSHAYAPYSNYQVASCICADDDKLFIGVNVENSSYGLTVCAESSAICQMIAAGRNKIKALIVMNGEGSLCQPCGACRQRIAEFSTPATLIHLCNHETVLKSYSINELLPYAFKLRDCK
ncbi:MAG: cytidine deaminase [Tatlockia sp.]|nr:cytidine deaminase [Tatlockia sp.]